MTTKRHGILCVDDEPNVLNALKRLLRREGYDVITTGSGREGLDILARETIHLILCDQRMPEMNGNEFLALVSERYPEIVRISLTGYTEVDAITEAINLGHIYKFFLKPWNDQQLKLEIRKALEYYELSCENRRLGVQLVERNHQLEAVNANLEALVRERTEELDFRNRALEISHTVLDNLSLPVVGISTDGTIVLANLEARKFFCRFTPFTVGMAMEEGLPSSVCDIVNTVLTEGRPLDCALPLADRGTFQVKGTPLRGNRIGQGVIVTTEQALPHRHRERMRNAQ